MKLRNIFKNLKFNKNASKESELVEEEIQIVTLLEKKIQKIRDDRAAELQKVKDEENKKIQQLKEQYWYLFQSIDGLTKKYRIDIICQGFDHDFTCINIYLPHHRSTLISIYFPKISIYFPNKDSQEYGFWIYVDGTRRGIYQTVDLTVNELLNIISERFS